MAAFWVAAVAGALIAVAYLALAAAEFRRARREALEGSRAEEPETDYDSQGRGFTWVAGGGVVVSTTLLVLASVWPASWYLLPFLSLGSAIAVVLAFLVDRRETGDHRAARAEAVR